MAKRAFTIGQASRLSGVPVRRIRFYADQGLLSRVDRSESGYRLFSGDDLVRLGLIRALRNAGLGLDAIRSVFTESRSIGEVLSLRLAEIEAQIASQRRIASAIRVALRSPEPNPEDLRRIWKMTSMSNAEHAAVIERFLDQVVAGAAVDPDWKGWMLRVSAPALSEDPSAEQLDAWIELSEMLADPDFVAKMRRNAEDSVVRMDWRIMEQAGAAALAKAEAAMAHGASPDSPEGRAIADEYLTGWARSVGEEFDGDALRRMRRKELEHRPNIQRYWELVLILRGLPAQSEPDGAQLWINQAVSVRLADA